MCALSRPLLIVLLLVMGGVSVWTPLTHDDIAERWFTLPNLYYFLPVPVLVLAFSRLAMAQREKTKNPMRVHLFSR